MRFELVKMPLIPAFLTLAALLAFGFWHLPAGVPAADPRLGLTAGELPLQPLGACLEAFSARFPVLAKWLGALMLLFAGTSLGRLSMRFNLYVTPTCLAMPLYGALMLGALGGRAWFTAAVASMLTMLVLRNCCLAYRNGFAFDRLFRAALFLSLLLLAVPAAAPLLLILPAALLRFRRTVRELIVALGGLLLPVFATVYLNWACGGTWSAPLEVLVRACMRHGWGEAVLASSLAERLFAVLPALAVLTTLLLFRRIRYTVGTKARHILYFTGRLFLLTLLVWPMPGADVGALGLTAVPAAVLLPVLFLRIGRSPARALYLAGIAAAIAAVLLR